MKKLFGLVLALIFAMNVNAEEHFLVGGCTASGWNSGLWQRSQVQMVKVDDTSEWICCLKLTVGEGDNGRFKIPNSSDGWDGYWAPAQGTVLTSDWSDLSTSGEGDYKWCVEEEGIYLVTINTETNKIKAEKLTAPSKDDNFYLVGSVDDYYYAAGAITSGENTGKIRLTADLDFAGKGFFPLAADKAKFKGEVDGQGHTINNAVLADDGQNIGLIRYASDGAYIHDLVMGDGCSFTANAKVGGIIGFARDGGAITITNVINKSTVHSTGSTDANAAGFVGCATDGTKVLFTNCANMGAVSGQDGQCAAYLGWSQGGTTLTNCWNSGSISNIDGQAQLYRNAGQVTATNCYDVTAVGNQGTKKDAAVLATGELCYLLNGDQSVIGWYQTIGTDNTPVPFSTHSRVYANGALKCDGTSAGGDLSYSNSSTSVVPPHTNANGWCTECGTLHKEYLTPADGYYQIGNANDLHWFASYVMDVDATVKAKMTADIDYTDYNNGFIGVPGKPFKGEFDGQEHTITIAISNAEGVSRTGLFAAINDATIKNLVVEGTASSDDQNCVGGLGGRSDGTSTIENVIVKTAVSYTGGNGDATCGGFFANMESNATLKNCAFLGSIDCGSKDGCGGLVGWAGSGSSNKYINCLVAPTSYTKNGNSADFARNNPALTNCVITTPDDTRFATGELCYTLNAGGDNWYQTLSTDAMPVPFASHSKVYANASYNCDGTPKGAVVYANVNEEQHDSHVLDKGFCSVCNTLQEFVDNYMTPVDGWYEISNNKQMRWFAAKVKTYRVESNEDSNARINARLMNDIDFEGVTDYQPIGGLWGQGNARYAGEFDGQFHKITNLHIDLNQDNVGVFGVIAEGAVIKHFTVDSSCSIKGNSHVGIIGEAWRSHNGEIHLLGIGNEADITGTGNNVGAILGVNMNNGGYAKLNMAYCYTTGTIKGNAENGQLTGWSGDNAYVENCYAIGEMTNCDGFGRLGGGSTIVNCYCDKDLTWNNHPTLIEDAWIASGELCYRLSDTNFRQKIGTDPRPVLDNTKPIVSGFEISDAGWCSHVTKCNTWAPDGVAAYAVTSVGNGYVTLKQVDCAYSGEALLMNGPKGIYFFNAQSIYFEDYDDSVVNLLASSNEKVTVDAADKYYVLAKPEGSEVGFYPVKEGSTIAAGKAYLIAEKSGAKFLSLGGEETAIEGVVIENLDGTTEIYNLAGQKLMNAQKGINIINGKKVLVK